MLIPALWRLRGHLVSFWHGQSMPVVQPVHSVSIVWRSCWYLLVYSWRALRTAALFRDCLHSVAVVSLFHRRSKGFKFGTTRNTCPILTTTEEHPPALAADAWDTTTLALTGRTWVAFQSFHSCVFSIFCLSFAGLAGTLSMPLMPWGGSLQPTCGEHWTFVAMRAKHPLAVAVLGASPSPNPSTLAKL